MNKSKLKILLVITLVFNFFIGIKSSFAAIRKNYFSSKSNKQQSSANFLNRPSTSAGARLTQSKIQTLNNPKEVILNVNEEEVKTVLSSTKTLVNDGNYTIVPKLKDALNFMEHDEKNFKKAFDSLTSNNFFKAQIDKYSDDTKIYIFEKNDEDNKNLYIKFSLNKNSNNLKIIGYNNDEVKFEEISPKLPDISTLLGNEKITRLNLIGRAADKALHIVNEKISRNRYYIIHRVKNELRELGYSYKDFIKIIKSLEKKHYILGPEPPHENVKKIDGTIWVFGYNDEIKGNELYIKFLIDNDEDKITFLSFHPSDRPLGFFFKNLE